MTPENSLYLAIGVVSATYAVSIAIFFSGRDNDDSVAGCLFGFFALALLASYILSVSIYRFEDAKQCQKAHEQCQLDIEDLARAPRCPTSYIPRHSFEPYIYDTTGFVGIEPWLVQQDTTYRRTP